MSTNRERTLKRLFEELEGISDKEYQRRVWIRGEGPECDDFGESVCRYSLLAESIFDEYKELGFSDIQFDTFKKFHAEYEKFWEDNDWPPLFIDTPEWTKITEMAKEVLKAFNHPKKSS